MVTHTFISKCNTIINGYHDNFGLNPIGMLNYGTLISRTLVYFDTEKLTQLVNDGTYCNTESLTHTLKLTNCGSIEMRTFNDMLPSSDVNCVKERATSFTVIAFKIPKEWHRGIGFDNSTDYWYLGKSAVSTEACNWYNAYNGCAWDEEGVYSNDTLSAEYEKFGNGEDSIVIGRQVFEFGNEDFHIDVTDFVNNVIAGKEKNYGIGLAFSPLLESMDKRYTQYVGFFTPNTNTFYKPYLETRYNEAITDDRNNFYLGKSNRLYLFANIGGSLRSLDELPTCTIEGATYPVKMQSKGVYYAEVKFSKKDYSEDTILYDTWSNLKYNGDDIDDIEMEFVTKKPEAYFSMGDSLQQPKSLTVSLSGINDCEKLHQGDKRIIKVLFKVPYTKNEYQIISDAKYKLHVKDGIRYLDVIEWDDIALAGDVNYFTINTSELIPQDYFIDIQLNYGNEIRVFKDELQFRVVDDIMENKK